MYERLIKEESPPKLEAFLKERPEMLDATSRALYRARALGTSARFFNAGCSETSCRLLLEPAFAQSG